MKIGVIGAGNMSSALGSRWAAAGHELLIAGRTPEKAQALAGELGARSGSLREAAAFGDVVFVGIRR